MSTIDEKRQAVYSSLCCFASEAIPLRQRAVQRLVLGALIGSSEKLPYNLLKIEKNLSSGQQKISLRSGLISEALAALVQQQVVIEVNYKNKKCYFISGQGDDVISEISSGKEDMFKDASVELFRDTTTFISQSESYYVFKKFCYECFARFGRQIAKSVTGGCSKDDLVRQIDARGAFVAAIEGRKLTKEQIDTLEARSQHFLRASNPSFEKLKFYLTQGFYFCELLCLDTAKFNPLAENAFDGAVFYLDTNVILIGLLRQHEHSSQYLEMVRLAKKHGIRLLVTRASLNELDKVIVDRKTQLEKIAKVLPDELAGKTSNQVVRAYYQEKLENNALTVQDFWQPFDELAEILATWGIEIDERDAVKIINERDTTEIEQIMNEEAVITRGWGKSPLVLQHDAAHYLLVQDQRSVNSKTWFLTRDGTMDTASYRLNPDQVSFSFSHVGFLQCISPFVTSISEELSLAEMMSAFISDQILPLETLFDISELIIMAEFHEDVMATPVDQLVMAFDYVKNKALKGERYREGDIPRVSLELKRFLAADRNEQIKALQEERLRLAEEAKIERDRRLSAEELAKGANVYSKELEGTVETLQQNLTATQQNIQSLAARLANQEVTTNKRDLNRLLITTIFNFVLWVFSLRFESVIFFLIFNGAPFVANNQQVTRDLYHVFWVTLWFLPFSIYVIRLNWPECYKVCMIAISAIIILWSGRILSETTISLFANLIEIAMFVTSIVFLFLKRKDKITAANDEEVV